jgi:hypothetical protein
MRTHVRRVVDALLHAHQAMLRGDNPGDIFRAADDQPGPGERESGWASRNAPTGLKAQLVAEGLAVRPAAPTHPHGHTCIHTPAGKKPSRQYGHSPVQEHNTL